MSEPRSNTKGAPSVGRTVAERQIEERFNPSDQARADALNGGFDRVVAGLSDRLNGAFVDKDDDNYDDYKLSDWKNAVREVGSPFYGTSDLLQLEAKPGEPFSIIQLRKITSSGYGTAYRNQPVGRIVAEVMVNTNKNTGEWIEYNFSSDAGRKAFIQDMKKYKRNTPSIDDVWNRKRELGEFGGR